MTDDRRIIRRYQPLGAGPVPLAACVIIQSASPPDRTGDYVILGVLGLIGVAGLLSAAVRGMDRFSGVTLIACAFLAVGFDILLQGDSCATTTGRLIAAPLVTLVPWALVELTRAASAALKRRG